MTDLHAAAHAKLNLTLDVTGRREDGYHDLRMVMQEIALGDDLSLHLDTDAAWSVCTESREIPADGENLALRAAAGFFREAGISCSGLTAFLRKRVPVCAGLGGGSADAAAVLRLLQEHYGCPLPEERLMSLAEEIGSDVPFALFGGTALAEGKGERLTRLDPLQDCFFVLCKPPFPVSTPVLYHAIDRVTIRKRPDTEAVCRALAEGDLPAAAENLYNVFYPLVAEEHPEVLKIAEILRDSGALGVSMSGSGPTMFGLFSEREPAEAAAALLGKRYTDTFLTKPVTSAGASSRE